MYWRPRNSSTEIKQLLHQKIVLKMLRRGGVACLETGKSAWRCCRGRQAALQVRWSKARTSRVKRALRKVMWIVSVSVYVCSG